MVWSELVTSEAGPWEKPVIHYRDQLSHVVVLLDWPAPSRRSLLHSFLTSAPSPGSWLSLASPLTICGSPATVFLPPQKALPATALEISELGKETVNSRVQRCPLLELAAQKFELKWVSARFTGRGISPRTVIALDKYLQRTTASKQELSLSQNIQVQYSTASSPLRFKSC